MVKRVANLGFPGQTIVAPKSISNGFLKPILERKHPKNPLQQFLHLHLHFLD